LLCPDRSRRQQLPLGRDRQRWAPRRRSIDRAACPERLPPMHAVPQSCSPPPETRRAMVSRRRGRGTGAHRGEVGYFDAPNASFDTFAAAVKDWKRQRRAVRKQQTNDTTSPHTDRPEDDRQEPIFGLRRNLAQYQEDQQDDWQPERRSPTLVRACPICGKPTTQITDQFKRQASTCPEHLRVKAVLVPPPAQDGTRWGHDYFQAPWTPSPEQEHHQRTRGERVTERTMPWAVHRAPRPQPKADSFLDPTPRSTRPS
jgi:hypothetical protein